MEPSDPSHWRRADSATDIRRATLRLGAIYWAAMFVSASILWGLAGTDPIESALGKLILFSCGALMTFGIAALLFRQRHRNMAVQILLCLLLSAIATPVFCRINYAIYVWCMAPGPAPYSLQQLGYDLVYAMSLFFGWSCLFVALLYNMQVRDQERRLAASREEALAAQMRALRYQINPHFLFNTLNSIAALIEEGAPDRAGKMILSLSDFLHETLKLDPLHDVPLGDELALQAGYLGIERERFSDRMDVRIVVPPELEQALVPSLILQPLVENAIKHGLGAGPGAVEIVISVSRKGSGLHIEIENDIPASATRRAGAGIGLRNVAERIQARFPGTASFAAGSIAPDRFRAALILPYRTA